MEQTEATSAPDAGRPAVFQHKVRDEGCPVLSETKYAIRTHVMDKAAGAIKLII